MIVRERAGGGAGWGRARGGGVAGWGRPPRSGRPGGGRAWGGGGAGWGRAVASLAGARPESFWTSQPGAPDPAPALTGAITADLAVVGGGFSGLWTALLARERDPSADVVLIEAATSGWGASGRNGGFCSASLTHGIGNGLARFPAEMPLLEKLGAQNLAEIGQTIGARGIDCDFSPAGELTVATQPWQLDELYADTEAARQLGHDAVDLDAAGVRRELDSPAFLGGAWYRDTCAMVDPGRLARGLRRACLESGVRLYENTRVRAITSDGTALSLATPYGGVRARQAALATGAYPALLRRIGLFFVPVYDYVLVTEPLSAAQLASLGWRHRQGAADAGNQFHYFRLTADNRILWGGYDAVYFNGGKISAVHDQRPETFARLAGHFFGTFPQLEDVSFEYAWGGAIDTCSRFFAFYGTAQAGRLGYACGHTGLGVGASRFAANVVLDLLAGLRTERTGLEMVRSRPVPFPPEPARSAVIQLTRASLARADRDAGRRNLWLRALDRLGLGFDSLGCRPGNGRSLVGSVH